MRRAMQSDLRLIRQGASEGRSQRQIAQELGRSEVSVQKLAQYYGVRFRPKVYYNHLTPDEAIACLRRLLLPLVPTWNVRRVKSVEDRRGVSSDRSR